MRSAHWMAAAMVSFSVAASAWAVQGEGLTPSPDAPWPRWQARLSFSTATSQFTTDTALDGNRSALNATLLGDYYFTRSQRRLGDSSGFRATSGLVLGAQSPSLLSIAPGATSLGRGALTVERRPPATFGLASPGEARAEANASPYVGIGYTQLSSHSGWGFSADVGLLGTPRSTVKLGRLSTGTESLDDSLRAMRLSPLLQLGVSYSF